MPKKTTPTDNPVITFATRENRDGTFRGVVYVGGYIHWTEDVRSRTQAQIKAKAAMSKLLADPKEKARALKAAEKESKASSARVATTAKNRAEGKHSVRSKVVTRGNVYQGHVYIDNVLYSVKEMPSRVNASEWAKGMVRELKADPKAMREAAKHTGLVRMRQHRTELPPEKKADGRKAWYKVVRSVDTTKDTGYAFDGEFLPTAAVQIAVMEVGSVIIRSVPTRFSRQQSGGRSSVGP